CVLRASIQVDTSLYLQNSIFHSISVQVAKNCPSKYIGHFETCSVIVAAGRRKPANATHDVDDVRKVRSGYRCEWTAKPSWVCSLMRLCSSPERSSGSIWMVTFEI